MNLALDREVTKTKFESDRDKMKRLNQTHAQKGEAKLTYILVGIALTIGVIFLIETWQDHDHDLHFHAPVITVH